MRLCVPSCPIYSTTVEALPEKKSQPSGSVAFILRATPLQPIEARHDGLTQPISVLITGIDLITILDQARQRPKPSNLSPRHRSRPYWIAPAKSHFDSTAADPKWLGQELHLPTDSHHWPGIRHQQPESPRSQMPKHHSQEISPLPPAPASYQTAPSESASTIPCHDRFHPAASDSTRCETRQEQSHSPSRPTNSTPQPVTSSTLQPLPCSPHTPSLPSSSQTCSTKRY